MSDDKIDVVEAPVSEGEPAVVNEKFIGRAMFLAHWARTDAQCRCEEARAGRFIADCAGCLGLLIGHAMTEAATPTEDLAKLRAAARERGRMDD